MKNPPEFPVGFCFEYSLRRIFVETLIRLRLMLLDFLDLLATRDDLLHARTRRLRLGHCLSFGGALGVGTLGPQRRLDVALNRRQAAAGIAEEVRRPDA